MKKIIAKTDIKPDYSKYVYCCGLDKESGTLIVYQVDRSARSLGKKKWMPGNF